MAEPSPKTPVSPEIGPFAANADAEVRIARDRLILTVSLPDVPLSSSRIRVTPSTVSITRPDGMDLRFALPARADPSQFVARLRNGVLDIVVLRART